MAKKCLICSAPVGFFEGQVVLADGSVCDACWAKAGGTNDFFELAAAKKKYTSNDILKKIQDNGLSVVDAARFSPNLVLGNFEFDDKLKIVKVKHQVVKEQMLAYSGNIC